MIVIDKDKDHFNIGVIDSNENMPDYISYDTYSAPENSKIRILPSSVILVGKSNAVLDYLEYCPDLRNAKSIDLDFIEKKIIPYITEKLESIKALGDGKCKFSTQYIILRDRCFMISDDFYLREITGTSYRSLSEACDCFYAGAMEYYKDAPSKERVLGMLRDTRRNFSLLAPILMTDSVSLRLRRYK